MDHLHLAELERIDLDLRTLQRRLTSVLVTNNDAEIGRIRAEMRVLEFQSDEILARMKTGFDVVV